MRNVPRQQAHTIVTRPSRRSPLSEGIQLPKLPLLSLLPGWRT